MNIGVVTATRAEYGLLKPLIQKINEDLDTDLQLIVTGTHLIEEYGYTVKFIKEDNYPIAAEVPVKICTNSASEISQTMGRYFQAFSEVFQKVKMDCVVVLGDRYELIPICFCAANAKIPIAHISGGEVTEGAIDDAVRHCITKLSYLHFPACEIYRRRIIQLGEDPMRVFNVGDPGVENIKKMKFLSRQDLGNILSTDLEKPYFLVIFHPITLDKVKPEIQIRRLLSAIENFKDIQFIFLKSNADIGGEMINQYLKEFVKRNNNCKLFSSLKIEQFLSLQKYSLGLIGNSSSGIVETPCLGIPTINIGDRQKGRLLADSIISCSVDIIEIKSAIKLALSTEFREKAKKAINPYGSGDTSTKILYHIKQFIYENNINLKKNFYDIQIRG